MSKWPTWFEGGEVRKPKKVFNKAWEPVRDRVEKAMTAVREQEPSKIGDPYVFINVVTKVVLAADQDEPLESIFADARMTEFVAQLGLRAAERRAVLAVKHALDPYAQQVAPRITRSPAEKPYTDKEIQAVLDWANYKQKAPLPRYKALVVTLGFGAGLRDTEMGELTWSQISVDELGCVIHLSDQDVPVLHRFDQTLIDLHPQTEAELGEYVLYPARKKRSSVASNVIARGADEGLTPTLARLRITWINLHVKAGVPLKLVQTVAGMSDNRTFERLIGRVTTTADIWSVRGLFHENSGSTALSAVESLEPVAVEPTKLAVPTEPQPAVTSAHFTAGVEPDFNYEYPDEALSADDHEYIVQAYLETTRKHTRVRDATTSDIFRTDTTYPMRCEDCSGWVRDGAVAAWEPDTGWVIDLRSCPTCKGRGWVAENSLDARERARAGDCLVEH